MYKTNKACLSQRVGGDQVLQEQGLFQTLGGKRVLGLPPRPTQPAALALLQVQLVDKTLKLSVLL